MSIEKLKVMFLIKSQSSWEKQLPSLEIQTKANKQNPHFPPIPSILLKKLKLTVQKVGVSRWSFSWRLETFGGRHHPRNPLCIWLLPLALLFIASPMVITPLHQKGPGLDFLFTGSLGDSSLQEYF